MESCHESVGMSLPSEQYVTRCALFAGKFQRPFDVISLLPLTEPVSLTSSKDYCSTNGLIS